MSRIETNIDQTKYSPHQANTILKFIIDNSVEYCCKNAEFISDKNATIDIDFKGTVVELNKKENTDLQFSIEDSEMNLHDCCLKKKQC